MPAAPWGAEKADLLERFLADSAGASPPSSEPPLPEPGTEDTDKGRDDAEDFDAQTKSSDSEDDEDEDT